MILPEARIPPASLSLRGVYCVDMSSVLNDMQSSILLTAQSRTSCVADVAVMSLVGQRT